ncbi:MAG: NADPH:quinone oxidoreductase [Sneathiella sp.]|jgi:NADPH2:quinone reductase|uniref:NADPH:quinone oxidoreductase family protein n=1 Tax=Sneathiella sp. TaxID=1964365 RepID=UPI000C556014|nr:NADPH:quinone oxidoreductase family protein [Sneathiella sp.]MAL80469.1 NADPH:quinone oxidoreductase [Sneathiella sp.]
MTDTYTTRTICRSLEGPGAVTLEQVPLAPLAPGQVRVRLKAAALNFPDLLMTYGKYQFRPELPFIPGMEAAGIVEETNALDAPFQVGDAVLYKSKTGAFAEHATASPAQLTPMPAHLSFEEAAAFSVTFLTAYVSLIERGGLQRGETLLVLGAGGGVGQATVAVGKALGARVIAGASSAEKLAIAAESGADELVNYAEEDFAARVMELTEGQGADVISDPVGGALFERSLDCIAWGGRLLVVGFAGGEFGILRPDRAQGRGCAVIGVRAGEFGRRDPVAGKRVAVGLQRFAEAAKLRPVIGKSWPLSDITNALRAMEGRDVTGKQVVVIGGGE